MKHFLQLMFALISTTKLVILETFRTLLNIIFARHKDISNDIILITGGGRGIGRKIALEFARYKPQHIVIWGRKEESLIRTCEDIKTFGVQCSYQVCDVSSRELIYKKAVEIQETIGNVTILVNNAGILSGKPVEYLQADDMTNTLKVNTLAHIWTIKAFLPAMIERGQGHIVCMSSVLGLLGLKGVCDYATSKFATTGLMESLTQELEEYPYIHTTVIHPYQVDNDMFTGMRFRFPKLFPPLTEDHVARASVNAVLTNRKQITLPYYFYFVLFLRGILPVSCMTPAQKFLGLDKVMDKFNWHNADGGDVCSQS